MLKVRKIVFLLMVSLFCISCSSTYVTNYYPKKFNQKKIAEYSKSGKKVKVGNFTSDDVDSSSIMCRMVGPVKPQKNMTFLQYIHDAFVQEFREGKLISSDAKDEITAELLELEMDSGPGEGSWRIKMKYKLNGKDWMVVDTEYEFRAGHEATGACGKTAQAFVDAVQQHMKKVILNKKVKEYFSK